MTPRILSSERVRAMINCWKCSERMFGVNQIGNGNVLTFWHISNPRERKLTWNGISSKTIHSTHGSKTTHVRATTLSTNNWDMIVIHVPGFIRWRAAPLHLVRSTRDVSGRGGSGAGEERLELLSQWLSGTGVRQRNCHNLELGVMSLFRMS